ncbi:MAG: PBP1A family penicillin-binding protein [Clostridia bacterium]|nr:PBP1A family penicillin-binding protein [Clostridia bacterium]
MSDPSTPRRRRAQRDASFSASDFPAENELSSVLPPEDGAPAEATGIYTIGQPTDNPAFFPEEEVDWGTDPFVLDDADHEKHSLFRPAVKKPNFVLSVIVCVIRILLVLVLLAGIAGLGTIAGIAKGYVDTAPTLNLAALDDQAQTSFIYDANGVLITEYKGTENRVMVSIAAMPRYLQQAFVAVEDARFYTHSGIDLKRIVGAFIANLTSSSTQGGSTITQQLIKNTLLSSEQSYKRKIQEAYLAMQLEKTYTKDQILESYLNTIYLGESYYGVQVAAQGYFGKSLGELTLRECAMLAGTCNSPYYYNPRRNFYVRSKEGVDYAAITNDRTNYVLRCMYENQFISYEQYQAALDPATAHVLASDPSATSGMYAYPHYVEYALTELVDILLEIHGLENTSANRYAMENELRTGGYRIQLAIDTQIQETLEDTLANWSKYPSLRDPADSVYRARNSDGTYEEIIQPQAAAVILDYRTGEIKAIVGSRTVPTARKTLNRATDMKMPVGSSIKPLSVYAPALEHGASPASITFNMPLPIAGWKDAKGNDTWPKNYGGGGYTGPLTLRESMRNSYNTGAAQTMMSMVGVSQAVRFLEDMGVDEDHIDATPFGVTLGSSGITPMQMTVAYGVLANGGVYQEPISVLGISDSEGRVVWDGHAHQERHRVFSSSTSYMIVDMLKTVVASGTGTSAKISGQTVAGKTGTNSDQKGVFFAGMTGYYASALWVGHDNYKALASKSTGSRSAAPLWQSYMSRIHTLKGLSSRDILEGDPSEYGLVRVTTCAVSGQLATEACYQDAMGYGVVTDYWAQGTQPTVSCQLHSIHTLCSDSGMLASDYCPNTTVKSSITLPYGHPLSTFLGTQYEDVIQQYLGSQAAGETQVCTLHTAWNTVQTQDPYAYSPTPENVSPYPGESDGGTGPGVSTQGPASASVLSDALALLSQAQSLLLSLDPSQPAYAELSSAIAQLQSVINSGAGQSDLLVAMGALSQAMGRAY